MKKSIAILLTLTLCLCGQMAFAQDEEAATESPFASEDEEFSYLIGLNVGTNLARMPFEINLEAFQKGIVDSMKGNDLAISQEQLQQLGQALTAKMQQEQQQKMQQKKEIAAEEAEKGKKFLEENAKEEGVITTDSGLQYQVLVEGDGPIPTAGDKVKTHYKGTLLDGTVFDSSYERGEPITFDVTGVIPGWQEALQLMKTGSKWKLFIPAELAYRDQGAGATIPPGATLIFEMELLEVLPKEEAAVTLPQGPEAAQ